FPVLVMSRFKAAYGAASMLQLLLVLLITVFIVTMVSISVVNQSELDSLRQQQIQSKRSLPHLTPRRLLIGHLSSVNFKSGLANHVFELISLIGIARSLGRKPALPSSHYDHFLEDHRDLPHLLEAFERSDEQEVKGSQNKHFEETLLRYHQSIQDELEKHEEEERIHVQVFHLQSFKYFSSSLSREEVLSLLELPHKLKHKAAWHLLYRDQLNTHDHRLCVHSRRRDFLFSKQHAASNELFTLPAIEFMVDYVRSHFNATSPLNIMIGDDAEWQADIVKSIYGTSSLLLPSNSSIPAVASWHFARMYCDSVLLTASSSTFGWWLAYQAKGKHVFYNSIYSKPGGFGRSLDPDDYFPHDWTALEFDPSTSTVGIRERFF
ncbi:hypothetical protein PENTCL1PPCAC_4053, partial [Pristionchus entomophagus]